MRSAQLKREDFEHASRAGALASWAGRCWPMPTLLEFLIERSGSRQLCLSRKLYGKIDVLAEEPPRKSSPGQKFMYHDAREEIGEYLQGTHDYIKDLVPELVPEQP